MFDSANEFLEDGIVFEYDFKGYGYLNPPTARSFFISRSGGGSDMDVSDYYNYNGDHWDPVSETGLYQLQGNLGDGFNIIAFYAPGTSGITNSSTLGTTVLILQASAVPAAALGAARLLGGAPSSANPLVGGSASGASQVSPTTEDCDPQASKAPGSFNCTTAKNPPFYSRSCGLPNKVFDKFTSKSVLLFGPVCGPIQTSSGVEYSEERSGSVTVEGEIDLGGGNKQTVSATASVTIGTVATAGTVLTGTGVVCATDPSGYAGTCTAAFTHVGSRLTGWVYEVKLMGWLFGGVCVDKQYWDACSKSLNSVSWSQPCNRKCL